MNSDITQRLKCALEKWGLIVRGGFHLTPKDALGDGSLIMIGNAGHAMWEKFSAQSKGDDNPLDDWTRSVIGPVAKSMGAKAIYPFDKPHPPIQQWAKRAENLASSPIGILIHPEFGLWHAYRAALVFPYCVEDFERRPAKPVNPCESCSEKPCLSACPVSAFSENLYDVEACAGHLSGAEGRACRDDGCAARNACPVGQDFKYSGPQLKFHMGAFTQSLAGR